jgi:hypothetical protein
MALQHEDENSNEALFDREGVGVRGCETAEERRETGGETEILRYWTNELEGAGDLIGRLAANQFGIEVQHLPSARTIVDWMAIVHLAGTDHDDVTCCGLDVADAAPGAMRTEANDTNAELVVGMPRKVLI